MSLSLSLSLCLSLPLFFSVRSELFKKPDGCSELRRAGFFSGDKRESGANRVWLGRTQLFLVQGFEAQNPAVGVSESDWLELVAE